MYIINDAAAEGKLLGLETQLYFSVTHLKSAVTGRSEVTVVIPSAPLEQTGPLLKGSLLPKSPLFTLLDSCHVTEL